MSRRHLLGLRVTGKNSIPSFKRVVLFRLAAIAIGLLPLFVLETVLQIGDWPTVNAVDDPYVGFTEIRPLFIHNESKTHYEISGSRFPLFQPDSFLIDKPEDEFRIFCVGGSTVQGRPFAIETAFSKWVELNLNVTDPSKKWRVINCGGVSYASYRLVPIVDEILNYEPNLIVLYTGHNEFLEDRTYESVKQTPTWIARTHDRLSSSKTYALLRRYLTTQSKSIASDSVENTLSAEVKARLDFSNGLAQYTRDDKWKQNVVEHFQLNLRRMTTSIQAANVPLIICNPTCDLRDSPPFKSENSVDLTQEQLTQFKTLTSEMKPGESSSTKRTIDDEIEILTSMLEIDPRHAMTHFQIATLYDAKENHELARKHFIQAKEQDICPLRATEPIYGVIAQVSQSLNTIDVRGAFEKRAPHGVAGRESLIDHVHPTIHGHQLIAEMLVEKMAEMKLVKSVDNETLGAEIAKRHSAHLESLPIGYFQRGKERLAGLKRWAAGEVKRERNDANSQDKP